MHSHNSSMGLRPSASNHNGQKTQQRSRSRTRSKDGQVFLPSNLTLTSNDHTAQHCQQHNPHNIFGVTGLDQVNPHENETSKNEHQPGLDISKRVVNRVESLRQFLLHGKLSHNQQEHPLIPTNCPGDGAQDQNSSGTQSNSQHHGILGASTALRNPSNHQHSSHTQCSCRPQGNGGLPTQGFVAHRQAAFMAAANGAMANGNQFRPGLAHTRRRSKSSERLGGGGPARLSIASPAFMATALPNGSHHPQLYATPPFLFATFNPQEVVR